MMADTLPINSKTAKVRHAEKDRKYSTCAFADRVAIEVIDTYKTAVTTHQGQFEAPKGQTVLAGFCQYDKANDSLICVSFGVGTKYRKYRDVSGAISPKNVCIGISEKKENSESLHDMHAEVIAKKGLKKYLEKNLRWVKAMQKEDPGRITFHMYVSTAPCGNAVVHRWGRCGLGPKFPDMPGSEWPQLAVDRVKQNPFHYQAKHEGQGSFLQKGFDPKNQECCDLMSSEVNPLLWPIAQNCQIWNPENMTTPLSCSDKILKWQVTGFEGSKLSGLFDTPIRISTLTCGRKFSETHLNRAVWERFTAPKGSKNRGTECSGRQNPITCLVTKLKFDEGVYNEESKQGADFNDPNCLSAFLSTSEVSSNNTMDLKSSQMIVQQLDGNTGLVKNVTEGCLETNIPMISQDPDIKDFNDVMSQVGHSQFESNAARYKDRKQQVIKFFMDISLKT